MRSPGKLYSGLTQFSTRTLCASLHFLVSVHFQVLIGNIIIALAFAAVIFNI